MLDSLEAWDKSRSGLYCARKLAKPPYIDGMVMTSVVLYNVTEITI